VTYEGFAAAWPNMMEQYEGPRRTELQKYTDMMNDYPKPVASTTLEEPLQWKNSTLIEGNVAEEVSRLKRQPGKNILVFGSGDLVNTLMKYGLIDEYRIMVLPIVLGSGKRLFRNGLATTVLELVDTKALDSGVVLLTYRPADE
jgi:dihydrofolate reductase